MFDVSTQIMLHEFLIFSDASSSIIFQPSLVAASRTVGYLHALPARNLTTFFYLHVKDKNNERYSK